MPGAWREFIGRHKEIAHPVCDSFIDVSLERTKDDYLKLVGVQVSQVRRIPRGRRFVATIRFTLSAAVVAGALAAALTSVAAGIGWLVSFSSTCWRVGDDCFRHSHNRALVE